MHDEMKAKVIQNVKMKVVFLYTYPLTKFMDI